MKAVESQWKPSSAQGWNIRKFPLAILPETYPRSLLLLGQPHFPSGDSLQMGRGTGRSQHRGHGKEAQSYQELGSYPSGILFFMRDMESDQVKHQAPTFISPLPLVIFPPASYFPWTILTPAPPPPAICPKAHIPSEAHLLLLHMLPSEEFSELQSALRDVQSPSPKHPGSSGRYGPYRERFRIRIWDSSTFPSLSWE